MDTTEVTEIKQANCAGRPQTDTLSIHPRQFDEALRAPNESKLAFWKVTSVSLSGGIAAGALLAVGSGAASATLSAYVLFLTAMGLFGLNLGIHRGLIHARFTRFMNKNKTTPIVVKQTQHVKKPVEIPTVTPTVATMVYVDPLTQFPQSDTYDHDKLELAKKALLSMDHTKAVSH